MVVGWVGIEFGGDVVGIFNIDNDVSNDVIEWLMEIEGLILIWYVKFLFWGIVLFWF